MKTNHLIDILSTNLEPVKRGQVGKTLAWALIIGGGGRFRPDARHCRPAAGYRQWAKSGLPASEASVYAEPGWHGGRLAAQADAPRPRWPEAVRSAPSPFAALVGRRTCRACNPRPRSLERDDLWNGVADLPGLHTALCDHPVCCPDLGPLQGSAHEFETHGRDRGTSRRVRTGQLPMRSIAPVTRCRSSRSGMASPSSCAPSSARCSGPVCCDGDPIASLTTM